MTQGLGLARSYPYDLAALTKRAVYNGGVSGETSTQIRTRMIASGRFSYSTIIWAGRNNVDAPTTVKADIAAMVAALGHTRYLVISILNGSDDPVGDDIYNDIAGINADLAATYGARYLDVRSYLVSLYNPNDAQDVIDHGNDVPPTSLRSDTLHLNDAGYQAVAAKVAERLSLLGIVS